MKSRFSVIYQDHSCFFGNGFAKDWNEVDETRKIRKLIYSFHDFTVVMRGYERYNHCIEYQQVGLKKTPTKIFIMGQTGSHTDLVEIDLIHNKPVVHTVEIGTEYHNSAVRGWKKGLVGNPKMKVFESGKLLKQVGV